MDDTAGAVPVLEAVKKLKPHSLVAMLADGSSQPIALPASRKKWQVIRDTLEALDWFQIRALDKAGNLLGVVQGEDGGEAFDDDVDNRQMVVLGRLQRLMLDAQDVALKRNNEQTQQLIDACVKMTRVMSERLIALEKAFASNLALVQEALTTPDETGSGLLSEGLLTAFAPLIAKRVEAHIAATGKGPTNGT